MKAINEFFLFKLKVLLMAAEGAIAMKKKILYVFSSLHFTFLFLWRSFQNYAS